MDFGIILSQNQTWGFKYIVWVLGKVMEGIFNLLDIIGIPNIGLSIIIFTILVNVLMIPLTYKQQKFSKLSMKMQPEIKAIQKKYEGKTDNDSRLAMNNEMQDVYGKYGVSPTGSCGYLLIQMPILFALYRVIYQMPGYVGKIKDAFLGAGLIDSIANNDKAIELVKSFKNSAMFVKQWESAKFTVENTIIDCLNRASTADWNSISENFPDLKNSVDSTLEVVNRYNNFLGLNVGNNPWYTMKESFASGAILAGIGAIMIPLLAGFTQWLNVKLSPQQPQDPNDPNNSMAASMRTMNMFMPLMSVWFGFTLPAGLGLYWIAGSVIRGIIMVIMNKKIDKMDFEELIKKNAPKNAKKAAKRKAQQEKINAYANMNTRSIGSKANQSTSSKANYVSNNDSPSLASSKGGSMMNKANAVKSFNEKNNK